MNIGAVSRATGISAKMIRYYEEIGLIPPPPRSEAGYRIYAQSDVHVLLFIRRARDLGFSVEGITELLSLWGNRTRSSREVKRLAKAHLARLDKRIAELQAMRDTLGHLVECCAGDDRPDCPILADLEHPGTPPNSASHPPRFGPMG